MKEKLLATTTAHLTALTEVQKRVRAYSGAQIFSGALLGSIKAAGSQWFDEVRPALQAAGFSTETLGEFSGSCEQLIRISRIKPSKTVAFKALAECIRPYQEQIIHQIEIGSFSSSTTLSIAPYIDGLSLDEGEYLAEAQRCLNADALRGCIVLGWCATVARIHTKIAELGYDKFSQATVDMAGKTTGRFKPFTKKHQVESRSDLQRIFDTDILWVLEFMELIDGNQHQRLRHCFEFRNNSAHPGLASIKPANLYSFYSDISEIVLKNPKFELKAEA